MAAYPGNPFYPGLLEQFNKETHDVEDYIDRFEQLCIQMMIIPPRHPGPGPNPPEVTPPSADATPEEKSAYTEIMARYQQAVSGYQTQLAEYNDLLNTYFVRKRANFLTIIGGPAHSALKNKCLTEVDKLDQLHITQLIQKFRELYQPRIDPTTAQVRFDNRVQKEDESVEDFILAIQKLARDCQFGTHYDTALKIKLCNGVRSEILKWELKKEAPQTYAAAIRMIDKLGPLIAEKEANTVNKLIVGNNSEERQRGNNRYQDRQKNYRSSNQSGPQRGGKPQVNSPKSGGKPNRWKLPPGQCWRCGQFHNPNSCIVKTWECSLCHKIGHRQRMCLSQDEKPKVNQINDEFEDNDNEDHDGKDDIIVGMDGLRLGKIYETALLDVPTTRTTHSFKCEEGEILIEEIVEKEEIVKLNLDTLFKEERSLQNPCSTNPVQPVLLRELCGIVNEENKVNLCRENSPLVLQVKIDNKIVNFELDTGSKYTITGKQTVTNLFPNKPIRNTDISLWLINEQSVKILGEIGVSVMNHQLKIIVAEEPNTFLPLLGRQWLDTLFPEWRKQFKALNASKVNFVNELNATNIERVISKFKEEFPTVFSLDKSQSIKGFKAHIMLKKNASVPIHKDYEIPFNLRDQTINLLLEMEAAGEIERVDYPKCASPVWPILKPDNSVRLVVDFSKTVNPQLKIDHYPLPKTEELLKFLGGSKIFVVLDLTDAYKQLEVTKESKDILTVNTLLGFFRYKRLIYGLASAAALFQCVIDIILKGVQNVKVYLDDVIIKADSFEGAVKSVREVLTRFAHHNVRVNYDKCQWFVTQAKYVGYLVDSEGVYPLPAKISAIVRAPAPKDVSELRSYLGMVRYYSRFVPRLSEKLDALNQLLCKNVPWVWSKECQETFQLSKELMATHTKLIHFDVKKPIVLICDASPKGISAILAHRINGLDIPMFCVSYTLSSSQKAYSQLHREALAVIVGVTKFHKYLYGSFFTIVTDNVAVAAIFNPDKGLPIHAHDRLIRYSVILAAHRYKVERRPSEEMGPADALSRLPLDQSAMEFVNLFRGSSNIPLNAEIVGQETMTDPVLSKVIDYVQNGWPSNPDEDLSPYVPLKDILTTEANCLLAGNRLIIPPSLRLEVLQILHKGHPGIVRSKMLARSEIYWPKMDAAIEEMCKQCVACNIVNFKPTKNFVSWPNTGRPWARIHIDFFQYKNYKFFIVNDPFSKWIEVSLPMSQTEAKDVILLLLVMFATFGTPLALVSDNGPPFQSVEFANFCAEKNIVLLHSPKYHAPSNGSAEKSVDTTKKLLKKLMGLFHLTYPKVDLPQYFN